MTCWSATAALQWTLMCGGRSTKDTRLTSVTTQGTTMNWTPNGGSLPCSRLRAWPTERHTAAHRHVHQSGHDQLNATRRLIAVVLTAQGMTNSYCWTPAFSYLRAFDATPILTYRFISTSDIKSLHFYEHINTKSHTYEILLSTQQTTALNDLLFGWILW